MANFCSSNLKRRGATVNIRGEFEWPLQGKDLKASNLISNLPKTENGYYRLGDVIEDRNSV
jgi:hypothetical protein